MNVEYFIARKLFTANKNNNSYTRPIIRIGMLAVSLSVAMMLIALMVLSGFKEDISSKIIGFGSHITITKFSDNQSYESEPVSVFQDFSHINNNEIKHMNVFATKAAIIKTVDEIQGVVLKGVSSDYDFTFFNENLVAGEVLGLNDSIVSNDILISEEVANLLQLDLDDNLVMYFIQKPSRARKFIIKGIYNTSMIDFDRLYVVADIKHIQNLNSWGEEQVGGFEIVINDFDNIEQITDGIYEKIPYDLDAKSIKDNYPQIFDWLNLQDINVRVILMLMFIVAAINMISTLLILIIDRISLIGILKAIGATNWSIRRIFLYSSTQLLVKGLLAGNFLAFVFAFIQSKFSIISLEPDTYYMKTVPINIEISQILLVNFGTIILCYLVLIIPSMIIAKITPVKAIRFE